MRRLKIPLLTFMVMIAFAGLARGQHIGCDDLTKSTNDSVRIVSTEGRPGDTVNIPLRLVNDSIVTAFQFLFEYDTTWLSPIFIPDSTCTEVDEFGECISWSIDSSYIDYTIHGRYLKTEVSGPFNDIVDTVTLFTANRFQSKRNVVACNFLPDVVDIDSLPSGNDVIFSIKFEVDPNMPHMSLSQFTFFESDIFTIDSSQPIPDTTWFNGCNQSQMTTVWWDGFETQTYQVFPTSNTETGMFFRADTEFVAVDDPTVSLSAAPTTVSPGGQSQLTWSSTNADEVILRNETSDVELPIGGALSGSYNVTLPTAEGTYQFSAEARQSGGASAKAFAFVTVSGGGGDEPSITFSPTDQAYSINQSETVSFTVQASEPDGDQVTLTANGLPNNASFAPTNPVIGTGTVSGTFSFTPDFDQEGTFVISFTGQDKDGSSQRSVTIVVSPIQVDRLFSTSALGQNPVGGLRGAGGIYFPINLITAKTVYGVQFDMSYPTSVVTVDSFVVTGRIPDYVVYDNIGTVPGEIRVVTFGLANEPVGTDTTSAILWAVMSLAEDAIPWTSHTILLENGVESVSPDPNIGSLPLVTDSGLIEIDNPGDVNLDKGINVADAVNIVAYIIETYGLSRRQFAVADVIVNENVNVFDLVGVVNLIYGITVSPSPIPSFPADTASLLLAYGDLSRGFSDILTIASEGIPEQIAGVQLEVSYDPASVILGQPSLTSDNERFALSYRDNGAGRMKLVLYHGALLKSDELIQSGDRDLVYIPITARTDIQSGDRSKLRLTDGLLATSSAASVNVEGVDRVQDVGLPLTFALNQNYPNPFNPETVISFSLSQRAQVELVIFNILGRQVKTLINDEIEADIRHQILWDATDDDGRRVATGVYLYRLKIGNESQTKKMLLLK